MNLKIAFSLVFAALLWAGCDEKPIKIPDLQAGARKVLIEELTGVRCQGCPDGTRQLIELQNNYGKENVIIVSIHAAGNFSTPYTSQPANQYDFRSEEGTELANYIGAAEGYPTAAVNRQAVAGSLTLFAQRVQWPGLIATELQQTFELDLFLQKEYDAATRTLNLDLNIVPGATLAGENRLSIFITQDSIVDVQQDGDQRVPNYIHRHVLRHIATAATGDVIAEPLIIGKIVNKKLSIVLDPAWVAEDCSVIALIHHGGVPDNEVLQVVEKHVVD